MGARADRQSTNHENDGQGQLPPPRSLQAPHHRHRQDQDEQIRRHAYGSGRDEDGVKVQTSARDIMIPGELHGRTTKGKGEEEGNCLGDDKRADDGNGNPKLLRDEHASVETKD